MEAAAPPAEVHARYKKSWIAYLKPIIALAILLGIAAGLYLLLEAVPQRGWIAAAIALFALVICVFNILMIRSVMLYTDDHGVWVYSGILPWSKGVGGVKWRDLEDAVYYPGFFSWALRSYRIRVGHRFTKTSEIVLTDIARGNRAVEHINELHRQVLASGAEGSERR